MTDLLAKSLQLKNGDAVLDAGCGRGTVACYLAQKYKLNITGIDIVGFELKMAKERAKKLKLKNVNFLLKDYSNTRFPSNYFDKIFTLETLVHSPSLRKTLKEFYRVLKPGGRLVLFEYSRSSPDEFNKREEKMLQIINDGSSMTSLKTLYHDAMVRELKKEKYKIISEEDITSNVLPSMKRLYVYAKLPYKLINFFSLHRYFVNTTAAIEFYNMAKSRLIKYRIFVTEK